MSRALAGMALSFGLWIAADVTADWVYQNFFEVLDETAVSLAAAFGIDYLITFIGARSTLRGWRWLSYTYFSALALVTATGLFIPEMRPFASSAAWSVSVLIGLVVFSGVPALLTVRYAMDAASIDERARTRTVLLAVLLGVTLAPIDALRTVTPVIPDELPRMSDLGSLVTTVLLYVVMSRTRIRGAELATSLAFQAVVLIGVVLFVSSMGFIALRHDIVSWLSVSVTGTAILMLVTYHWVQINTEDRERNRNLSTLGRLSAQLAHDLRNPIAAIKSAAEFVEGEVEHGRAKIDADTQDYLALIREQADRMNQLVERYRFFSDQAIQRTSADVKALIADNVDALRAVIPNTVRVEIDAENVPARFSLDSDLIGVAFDNLVRNAVEAMPDGGTLTVCARSRPDGGLTLSVSDTGTGLSPVDAEQVFQEFYTTKAHGSGLGLAFVRRIVENHRGRVELESGLGRGTRVSMVLPRED